MCIFVYVHVYMCACLRVHMCPMMHVNACMQRPKVSLLGSVHLVFAKGPLAGLELPNQAGLASQWTPGRNPSLSSLHLDYKRALLSQLFFNMASRDHTRACTASTSLTELSPQPTSMHFKMYEQCENQGPVKLNMHPHVLRGQSTVIT